MYRKFVRRGYYGRVARGQVKPYRCDCNHCELCYKQSEEDEIAADEQKLNLPRDEE